MPTNCLFLLERPKLIYYTGEHISGKVRLSTTKRLKCEAISLAFVGFGHVQWVEFDKSVCIEHNDSERIKCKKVLTGQMDFIYSRIYLKEKSIIEPGTRDEEFCIVIPDRLPGSTKQEYGEISYKLIVNLKRQTKCSKIFEQTIYIKKTMDLCDNRFFFVPFTSEANGLCFTTNATGFTPGQVITFTLQQNSASSFLQTFTNTKIALFQSITYTSQEPFIKKKKVVKLIKASACKDVSQFPNALIQYGALQIPLTLPVSSDCTTEQLLMISYYLEAFIYTSKKKILQKLKIPITLGTKVPRSNEQNWSKEERLFCYDNYGITDVSLEDLTKPSHFGNHLDLSCSRFKTVPYNGK